MFRGRFYIPRQYSILQVKKSRLPVCVNITIKIMYLSLMYVYVFLNLEGFFNVIRKNYFPRWPKRAFTNRIIPCPMSFNNQRLYSCITLTSKQLSIYLLCTTQICTLFLSSRWICTSHNVLITQKMLASSDILDAGLCTKVQTRQQSSFKQSDNFCDPW